MNCVIRRIVSSSLRVEELQAFINRGRAMGKQGQRIDTDICAQREKTLQYLIEHLLHCAMTLFILREN